MMPRHWRNYLLVAGDLAILNAGLWLALSVRHLRPADLPYYAQHFSAFNILFALWVFVAYAVGLYDLRRLRGLPFKIRAVLTAAAVNILTGIVFFYFFYPYRVVGATPKTHLVLTVVFGHLGIFLWRRTIMTFFRMTQFRERVAFLGETPYIREVREDLHRHPQLGYVPVPLRIGEVDLVVADVGWLDDHWDEVRETMGELVARRVRVMALRDFYETLMGKVMVEHAVSAAWLLSSVLERQRGWYLGVKRWLDLAAAGVLFVATLPVMAAAAVLIRFFDGPPVLFGQRRIGHLGAEFMVWKFRTMAPGAENRAAFPADGETGEKLVTPVGAALRRCRIDELPQLWNVLVGEMSMVGPRPEWTREVEALERVIPHYQVRHLVRPGITGWAQLNFRATRDPGDSLEKFRYDLYYLVHASLDLDLTILLRTVRRVFVKDAAMEGTKYRELFLGKHEAEHAAHLGALLKRHRN
ncbi:MAG: sugar transferase [Candidatus Coatesbacteria bacterium]